ncbi:unnamed protein product [Caenorhabditis brenneri]
MKLIVILLMNAWFPVLVSGECKSEQNEKYRTSVEYNGTVTCTLKPYFCAMFYYVEWDRLAKNEDLHFIRLHCTKTGTLFHHAYVYFIGGDGWNDDYYEPRIEVYHDCSKDFIRYAAIDLEPVSVHKNAAKRSYSFDVSNRGSYGFQNEKHQNRYREIPGENNPYIADWLDYKHEKTLVHEGIFETYDEQEEGCLKA